MAIDRQATGWIVIRVALGTFFFFEGLGKIRWFLDASILAARLHQWLEASPQASLSRWYLERVAIPWTGVFARLVPLGELTSGLALVAGLWTPVFAFVAFFMALNFQFASGTLVTYGFLTNAYGLPVLGSTLGLSIGGSRLPLSLRR